MFQNTRKILYPVRFSRYLEPFIDDGMHENEREGEREGERARGVFSQIHNNPPPMFSGDRRKDEDGECGWHSLTISANHIW